MIEKSFFTEQPFCLYVKNIKKEDTSKLLPILMISGSNHTGHCYEYSPDGRPGLGYYFAEKGFDTYIMDWPGLGRSGYVPSDMINGNFFSKAVADLIKMINKEIIVLCHSMSGPIVWKLPDLLDGKMIKKIVALAPGEMGNIQGEPTYTKKGKDVFEITFGRAKVKYVVNRREPFAPTEEFIRKKIIGNSRQFPKDHIKEYKATLKELNPNLLLERLNIDGSQLKIDDPRRFKGIDILVVTGTDDADHPREKDKKVVDYFVKNGIKADYCYLGDLDVKGNGHMLMLEKNNYEIADKILEWIKKGCAAERWN